ncbi:uncharacterized protein N7459_001906 [Penicillium hispanicum]|uniref:uncharacterized protein n=1 Tax=Penicillium hispanicum TaxID=1080232 RepID=UPI002540D0AB|nr:uncharacterized protein N7459_001906 [Penicillium hispanicum]KAJ5591537.1 hypothetical protein N7459_001906 [Penicillium hispanicum]
MHIHVHKRPQELWRYLQLSAAIEAEFGIILQAWAGCHIPSPNQIYYQYHNKRATLRPCPRARVPGGLLGTGIFNVLAPNNFYGIRTKLAGLAEVFCTSNGTTA